MPHILVNIIFESHNNERVFYTEYRPLIRFLGSDEYNSGMLEFIDCKSVLAGKSIHAHLTMLVFERVRSWVKPGAAFSIHESPFIRVGHGHVLFVEE